MKSIDDQIKCVAREIALRKNVYPKSVANGRMKQETADHEIACMEAVIESLQKLNTAVEPPAQMDLADEAEKASVTPIKGRAFPDAVDGTKEFG